MGVSAKGRRRIQYHGQNFVWWIAPDSDDCDRIYLNIVSEDKSIVLAYRVNRESFRIISKGRRLHGEKTSGKWQLCKIPFQEPLLVVTPKDVTQIIAWAVGGKGEQG
ncbi:MAG: hypothetical protein K2G55_13980 [Lachnospiraceae bacterium]|nr:hypothetical protein [Lachnospiraceae bacterium]MDE7205073.1 hypothetical protein [Lachnospiraceae bacterium]